MLLSIYCSKSTLALSYLSFIYLKKKKTKKQEEAQAQAARRARAWAKPSFGLVYLINLFILKFYLFIYLFSF